IKSSGYRIGPFEIESIMLEHDAVREVAVTGVPDPVRGFAVKATVVLADGWQGSDELTAELQKWVKRQTAPYKYPRIIEYVDELPRTVNGKIRRAAIREQDKTHHDLRRGPGERPGAALRPEPALREAGGLCRQRPAVHLL
ncbi:hypothetical protein P0G11_12300, partial [Adlercreutzia rubneri]|uniref:AMP-binding enzyme n=1 Tax=Adlercreutzia rubneri TaxID=2916441 RepID=UPI003F9FC8A6|nr:hypothetical protein [Adlercreutzia rubneri]